MQENRPSLACAIWNEQDESKRVSRQNLLECRKITRRRQISNEMSASRLEFAITGQLGERRREGRYQGREPSKSMSTNFRAFAGQWSALPAAERP
jgi:hypothetical protein